MSTVTLSLAEPAACWLDEQAATGCFPDNGALVRELIELERINDEKLAALDEGEASGPYIHRLFVFVIAPLEQVDRPIMFLPSSGLPKEIRSKLSWQASIFVNAADSNISVSLLMMISAIAQATTTIAYTTTST